jgi:hypothetical protein
MLYNHGCWLTPEEVAAVISNEDNIIEIVERASAAGKITQDEFITTRPQPTIVEDVEGMVIDPENVEGYLP